VTIAELRAAAESVGRTLKQRTTLYGEVVLETA
jgi:FO synthase